MLGPIARMGVCLGLLTSCSGTAWQDAARQSIESTHETARLLWQEARPKLLSRAIVVGQLCAAQGREQTDCESYQRLRVRAANIGTALAALHALVAQTIDALDTGRRDAVAQTQRALATLAAIIQYIEEALRGDLDNR